MAKNYRPLAIPDGVKVNITPDEVTVKGKLGTLAVPVRHGLKVDSGDDGITVTARGGSSRAHVGTLRALLRNAFTGVAEGFEKALQVRGMGYRVNQTKGGVQIQCGYSHQVEVNIPDGLTAEVNQLPNPDDTKQQMFEIVLKGIDKQLVGEVAAEIREIKPPDVYLGKGIRYRGEYVRKKAGKRAVGSEA